MSELVPELMEDLADIEKIVVIGPGKMLADARKKRALSQQDVADKLNFRVSLVSDIESEQFDKTLPETYNRGYLKNYAKLVDISKEDVLTSYDMLKIDKTEDTEMLSFSKGTVKEAENNLLMWISYLILAILVGLTVMWWLQDENRTLTLTNTTPKSIATEEVAGVIQPTVVKVVEQSPLQTELDVSNTKVRGDSIDDATGVPTPTVGTGSSNDKNSVNVINNDTNENATSLANSIENNTIANDTFVDETNVAESTTDELIVNAEARIDTPTVTVSFTFSGDCWVNIYDATGERIAWGIKKLGYVMNINGQAPFNVTLGKPELVTVDFDGQAIDMSQFRVGQIAKFSLPLAS